VATWRRRLLHLILESPAAPRAATQELATLAGWTVPDDVTVVAVAAGAKCATPMLDGDILLDIRRPDPYLLVPGQVGAGRQARLATAIPEGRLAVGLTVPLARRRIRCAGPGRRSTWPRRGSWARTG